MCPCSVRLLATSSARSSRSPNIKTTRFPLFHALCRFTDDTVQTVARRRASLMEFHYARLLKSYYRVYPHAGYGGMFRKWAQSERNRPYNSFGNGSAMRVSPAGFAYNSLEAVLTQAHAVPRSRTITPRVSRVPRPSRRPSSWPAPARVKNRSRITLRQPSGTGSIGHSMRSVPPTSSTSLARDQCLEQSRRSSSPPTSRMLYAKRYPWVETPTRKHVSQAVLPRLSTAVSPNPSLDAFTKFSMRPLGRP